ncbi:hypothetical protein B0H15DRAFT_951367 [Mycena belliarum]|uniref:Uncharacterized protein n=1 Tax=Mycena belliarum TaxID=1033014 RepID=A0AAD6U3Z6_9AGAR|nr:hypothetical protein B0H15DRAFT_951367 [Mycena belliae]
MPDREGSLEAHIKFPFQKRLMQALASRDPPQIFPEEPLAEELPPAPRPGYAHAQVQTTGHPQKLTRKMTPKVKAHEAARVAVEREHRFRLRRAAAFAERNQKINKAPPSRAALRVAVGGSFDPRLIEDRDYDLDEVVGPNSAFRFRLVPWGGRSPRAVIAADKSVVLVLGGGPRNRDWVPLVVAEANECCHDAAQRIVRSPEDLAANIAPTLSGGVGQTFNEDVARPNHSGIAVNALIFLQLFCSLGIKRLVGYGNRLLEVYCTSAFAALEHEKQEFLEDNNNALYPCDSSVFSAVTWEFGGPHRYKTGPGVPDRLQPGSWSVLTALGNFAPVQGGHIIFWELGLVVRFPAGACILIPAGILHYSFVKVRTGEHRYSMLQWAGAGISRWFANGRRMDIDFAVNASAQEHDARENARQHAHESALDHFPVEAELPAEDELRHLPFMGTDPRGAAEA